MIIIQDFVLSLQPENFLLLHQGCPTIGDIVSYSIIALRKEKGDLNGVDAVWINDQYRLFFHSSADNRGIVVNALIFEISKHYE